MLRSWPAVYDTLFTTFVHFNQVNSRCGIIQELSLRKSVLQVLPYPIYRGIIMSYLVVVCSILNHSSSI